MRPSYITLSKKSGKYGITEKKKAELDALKLKVLDAGYEVDQYIAIEASLNDRLNTLQSSLVAAENNRTLTLNNRNIFDQLLQSALDLNNNSEIALQEMQRANGKTKALSEKIRTVMDMLIYSAEIINKLSLLVSKKKDVNPLISDELLRRVNQAGVDANTAVASTLVALKSAFAASAANTEAEATTALGYVQSVALYQMLIRTETQPRHKKNEEVTGPESKDDTKAVSLKALLYQAYSRAKLQYDRTQTACITTTQQLNEVRGLLNKAQIKLKSLQSGLAAANAAALAS